MQTALIVGLAGPHLTSEEAAYLRRVQPVGVILFARNVETPLQVRRLIDDARTELAPHAPLVLIDQEGGRVQRLRPPYWRDLPAAASYAALYERDPTAARRAAVVVARLMAQELRAQGLNTNCTPCLDIPVPGADAIIGDRAFGGHVEQITDLASAVAEGHVAGGVLPVIKHIPGHGRAGVDSHKALPIVDTPRATLVATDFAPFRRLNHLPAAMTAHVVYSAIDPTAPASTSSMVIADVIRSEIGFTGLVMSDDLSMEALKGNIGERTRAVLAAGCDVALHCNGNLSEMEAAAQSASPLEDIALQRLQRCLACVSGAAPRLSDQEVMEAEQWLNQLGAAPFGVEAT